MPGLNAGYASDPRVIPACRQAQAHSVSAEQSKFVTPFAPHTYGVPSFVNAALTACRAAGPATGHNPHCGYVAHHEAREPPRIPS